ncbi:MAG TPA: flagellar FliJ family protein [Gemmatimonadales bacterium]|nr:flagellar FliJ family protein [Gemmatimonadales bacterium]
MKRFHFRLDRLLQLRAAAEQERARALGRARQHAAERREVAEASARHVLEVVQQLAATPSDLRTAGTLRNLMLTLDAAKLAQTAAEQAHVEAEAALTAELASYDEARQARRALERLRDERRAAWEREAGRVEQQTVDEVALRMRAPESAR